MEGKLFAASIYINVYVIALVNPSLQDCHSQRILQIALNCAF